MTNATLTKEEAFTAARGYGVPMGVLLSAAKLAEWQTIRLQREIRINELDQIAAPHF